MSIKDFVLKIKPLFSFILIILGAGLFFGLGRLSAQVKDYSPVSIVKSQIVTSETAKMEESKAKPSQELASSGEVIGSKNGTKYYLPWCGALSRIKPENRVVFASAVLAREKGYTPAANCKGVK
ncbi:MAG: hypothetical protein ACYCZW_01585 [Minisyncoccota bacterium]